MKSGLELKILRIKKKIKGVELAEKLNVDQSYISKMENEIVKIPEHIYTRWIQILSEK